MAVLTANQLIIPSGAPSGGDQDMISFDGIEVDNSTKLVKINAQAAANGNLQVFGQTSGTTLLTNNNLKRVTIGGTVSPFRTLHVTGGSSPGIRVDGSANPAIDIFAGSANGVWAIATSTGAFSNQAVANDMIVRGATRNLILSARSASGEIFFTTQNPDTIKMRLSSLGKLTHSPKIKFDGRIFNVSAEAQTNDATVTTLASITLADENVYHVKVKATAVQSDGSNRASYEKIITVFRTGAGSATIQGTISTVHEVESNAAWDLTLDVSGNDVRVRVTGIAATTIEWGCQLEHENISN